MDDTERLNLQKMIDANNVVDCTEQIRDKKHSAKIKTDVQTLLKEVCTSKSFESGAIRYDVRLTM